MKKAAFFGNTDSVNRVYGGNRKEIIASKTDLYGETIDETSFGDHRRYLDDLQIIFSTWGMPALSHAQVGRLPNLEAVFYGAGTVKYFAVPFLESGIRVFCARGANAIPVAEFVLGQILLSCKGYFRNTSQCRSFEAMSGGRVHAGPGIFDITVALIGAGSVARHLVNLLRPFRISVAVVDPYLSDTHARELGVTKLTMREAFQTALVVSNHLPNLASIRGIFDRTLFGSMLHGATFINTGRGAQVNEQDLIYVLRERPDITALLDVTYPEPPESGSALYILPNAHLSSHIAGSIGNEVVRMADCMIGEFDTYCRGGQPGNEVTLEMLETMA